MKTFIVPPNENWIVDRIAAEWRSYSPDHDCKIEECDVFWLAADWRWRAYADHIHAARDRKALVVATVHHIVPNKFDEYARVDFLQRDALIDVYHCPNIRTANLVRMITHKYVMVIPYWYNSQLWYPHSPEVREAAREKLQLTPESYLIGSFQRDTEGYDLRTPKLEKGPDIFCDYVIDQYNNHNPNIRVLLGGWRRQYVAERLAHANVPYTYLEMSSQEEMLKLMSALDLYVVSSRYEGGPQALLECAASKVPIISTPVGMAEYVLHKDSINLNLSAAKPDVEFAHKQVQQYEMQRYIPEYETQFRIHWTTKQKL